MGRGSPHPTPRSAGGTSCPTARAPACVRPPTSLTHTPLIADRLPLHLLPGLSDRGVGRRVLHHSPVSMPAGCPVACSYRRVTCERLGKPWQDQPRPRHDRHSGFLPCQRRVVFRRLSRPESLGRWACPWGGAASLWASAAQVAEGIATCLCAWKEALLT